MACGLSKPHPLTCMCPSSLTFPCAGSGAERSLGPMMAQLKEVKSDLENLQKESCLLPVEHPNRGLLLARLLELEKQKTMLIEHLLGPVQGVVLRPVMRMHCASRRLAGAFLAAFRLRLGPVTAAGVKHACAMLQQPHTSGRPNMSPSNPVR